MDVRQRVGKRYGQGSVRLRTKNGFTQPAVITSKQTLFTIEEIESYNENKWDGEAETSDQQILGCST